MPKTKGQKVAIVSALAEKLKRAKSLVFMSYDSLPVKDASAIRRELKASESEYYVAKKTLLNIAFKQSDITGIDSKALPGKIAVVMGYGDELAPAKVMDKFAKALEGKLAFLGGRLEGKALSAQEAEALALIPSRTELYAKLVGSINMPVSGFVNVLAGNLRGLMNVLKAIEEKKAV